MAKARAITGLDAQAPLATNARLIAQARLADLYQWEHAVDTPDNTRELHDMRIAAKRLRYTFEVFEDVFPAASKAIVSELTRVQDELGELHDSDVMIALLRMRLADQNGGAGAEPVAHGEKSPVPADMAAYLLDPDAAPAEEQRGGLEAFLRQQERLRTQRYNEFRRHWRQLQKKDFRREVLDVLGA